MDNGEIISLENAKDQFTKLMNSLTPTNKDDLLSFAIRKYISVKPNDDESDEGSYTADDVMDDPVALLNSIAKDIKEKAPSDAILPCENSPLMKNQNANCDLNVTRYVDAFLYNEDDLEDLVKDGKLSRNYCADCGSANTKPLTFISHSTSREELYHIFNTVLPPLDDKTVLDVGSRLGAILYGAYAYTDAKRIIGLETNEEYCDLQKEIVRKYKMEKRVEIMNKRIENAVDVVKSADVLILNNVFKFYLPESQQADTWRFLRANVKSGAYIVSRPDVSIALSAAETGIVIDEWLKAIETPSKNKSLFGIDRDNECDDNLPEIGFHLVL